MKYELTKDDNGDVDRTKDAKLICFFEEAIFALRIIISRPAKRMQK